MKVVTLKALKGARSKLLLVSSVLFLSAFSGCSKDKTAPKLDADWYNDDLSQIVFVDIEEMEKAKNIGVPKKPVNYILESVGENEEEHWIIG